MSYQEALERLTAYCNAWKPDPDVSEVLETAMQALYDCKLNKEGVICSGW